MVASKLVAPHGIAFRIFSEVTDRVVLTPAIVPMVRLTQIRLGYLEQLVRQLPRRLTQKILQQLVHPRRPATITAAVPHQLQRQTTQRQVQPAQRPPPANKLPLMKD